MPTILVGTQTAETPGNSYLWGGYAYAADGNFGEDNAVAFMGSITADYDPAYLVPAGNVITDMKLMWGFPYPGHMAYAWDEGYYDSNDNWVGNDITLELCRHTGAHVGWLHNSRQGADLSGVDTGPYGSTEHLYSMQLDSSWWANPPRVYIRSPYGYIGISDVCLQITYAAPAHTFARDQSPIPTTTTPRAILCANRFDEPNAQFLAPSTVAPAEYDKRLLIHKPDLGDPTSWYWTDEGHWFRGAVT